MNSLGNFATLIVNAPDFSRFASQPSFGMKYLVYTLSIQFVSRSPHLLVFWSLLLLKQCMGNRSGLRWMFWELF